jgi:transposase
MASSALTHSEGTGDLIELFEDGGGRCGVEVHVMQPSSLPVDRRARRAKTDVIDVGMLLRTLMAWLRDEPRVCSMVPIPDEADEEARRAHNDDPS